MSELTVPEDKEVKTLSAPGNVALEDKRASTKAATEAVRSAESEADQHVST